MHRRSGSSRTALGLWAILAMLCFWLGQSSLAYAGDIILGTPTTGNFNVALSDFSSRKFTTTIHQQFDYSCGSAALATLLRYHYGLRVNETTVFQAMYAVGDKESIQKLGFSLLDMKKYLATIGYQADGFRITLDQLAQVGVPAIALIQNGGYKHFVVVKGVAGNFVLIGDPSLGLRVQSRDEFLKQWSGIAFLIRETPPDTAKPVFNNAVEWNRWADANPLTSAVVVAPLAPFLANLRVLYQIEPNQILPNVLN